MRILVVEDEPRLLRNLAKALREEGYAVDTSEAGDEGLYKAENYNYDAIVLDVMLPRLDGWEVLERLRKQKPLRAAPRQKGNAYEREEDGGFVVASAEAV